MSKIFDNPSLLTTDRLEKELRKHGSPVPARKTKANLVKAYKEHVTAKKEELEFSSDDEASFVRNVSQKKSVGGGEGGGSFRMRLRTSTDYVVAAPAAATRKESLQERRRAVVVAAAIAATICASRS